MPSDMVHSQNLKTRSIGWGNGGDTFFILPLRIKPYLVGVRVRSQGSMTSYANDVIT